MAETRVLLVGDDGLAREGIAALLSGTESIRVAESVTADAALRSDELSSTACDVIVADPHGDIELLEKLSTFNVPIVALVADRRSVREHLIGNVRAVILRQATKERLVSAIHAIAHQLMVIDEALVESIIRPPSSLAVLEETLTPRESEVLQLLAAALSNKEIASRLGISEHTAKFHVNAILAKLGADSRTEAVVRAVRLGLIAL